MPKKVSTIALTGLLTLSLFSSIIPAGVLLTAPQTAEAASPAITSYLQTGSSGTQVTLLQQALYRLGYLTAAPTGTYGPMTTASVKKFQLLNGIPQTGALDMKTMYLVNLIIARFGAGALASTPRASVPSTTYIPKTPPVASSIPTSNTLAVGSTGTRVTSLQQMLITQKLLNAQATGYFGTQTRGAVVAHQSRHSLPATGVADTQTQSSIASVASKVVADNTPIPTTSTPIQGVKDAPIIRFAPPMLSFSANTTSIPNGGSVTLTWSTSFASFCSATGASFNPVQPIEGSALITNITSNQTYTLTCSGPGGQDTKSVTVTVSGKENRFIGPPIAEPPQPTPTPAPAPVPNPASKPVVVAEGDSISAFWAGNYTGIYAAAHPGIQFYGTAVGGSGINSGQPGLSLTGRLAADAALKPNYVTVFIGANDMPSDAASIQSWINSLWSYVADVKRATGAKVAVATLIGHCIPNTATFNFDNYNRGFNQQRVTTNNAIRAEVGNKIDAVIDFAADPAIGTDAAACNTAILPDGTHPSDLGQQKMATIYTAALDALIADRTPTGDIPTPIPAPLPKPTPTPTPTPTGNGPGPTSASPVLQAMLDAVQLPSIPSNFNRASELQPAWGTGEIPPSGFPDVVGAFRFGCNSDHESFDDPIVYPGQPGKSHLHEFFGNTNTNANSTYATLRSSGGSTCDGPLNRSAYWVPALLDGNEKVIKPNQASVYYKQVPETSAACLQAGKGCVPLPRGLKMLAGYNTGTGTLSNPGTIWWNCVVPTRPELGGHFASIVEAAANCPEGPNNEIEAVVVFPSCWDGKNLDSADHRSHIGYADYRKGDGKAYCPDAQPYLIPQVQFATFYSMDSTLDHSGTFTQGMKTWHLSSDIMPNMPMKTPGTTLHSDWFGAWDDPTMKTWWDNCTNKLLNCSGGVLGDGTQLKQFSGFTSIANPHLIDQPPRPGGVAMSEHAPLIPSKSIAVGSQTPEVTAIQQILKTAGYFKQAVTGYFGSVTQAALAAYNKGTQYAGAASSMPGMTH